MSRIKIGVVVALVVSALAAAAFFLTTSSLEKRIRSDVTTQVGRSRDLWIQNARMESLDRMQPWQSHAMYPGFSEALASDEVKTQESAAASAIRKFLAEVQPANLAFVAIVNAQGRLVAISVGDVIGFERDWKQRYPAVARALEAKREIKTITDIWNLENNGIMRVVVAPIVDVSTGFQVRGAVVAGHSLDDVPKQNAKQLGGHVVFFREDKIFATSFGRAGGPEDRSVSKVLFENGLAKIALEDKDAAVQEVKVGDETYFISVAKMPLSATEKTGAAVLTSLTDAMAPVGSVKVAILLLGIGALVIAILAMVVTARLILNPAEEIELGVTEIINGNIDYTFRPVGADLDGLANALNVMLARLVGRPEPGEEEYDDEGNVIGGSAGKVLLLDEGAALGGGQPASDPETLALAEEPEADYYRRLFNEYTEARGGLGEKTDSITYEGFVAKLRLNEGNLRKKYNCRAVRFKVQTKDDQVTLKPVPIL